MFANYMLIFQTGSPRRSPYFEQKQNVTSGINNTARFQFTAMAYPPPRFQWYRVINGSETSEAHEGFVTNYSISTNEMQTNFNLDKVEEHHYGEYLLKVENQYGTLTQTFYLVAEGKVECTFFYSDVSVFKTLLYFSFKRVLPYFFVFAGKLLCF